jgi:hypothetical protein
MLTVIPRHDGVHHGTTQGGEATDAAAERTGIWTRLGHLRAACTVDVRQQKHGVCETRRLISAGNDIYRAPREHEHVSQIKVP